MTWGIRWGGRDTLVRGVLLHAGCKRRFYTTQTKQTKEFVPRQANE